MEEFGVAIEKPRNITKAQRSGKIHVPVDVGGGILLSYFAKCRKNEDIARREIAHRKIKLEEGVHLQLDAPPLQTMGLPEMKDLRLLFARSDMMRAEGTSWTKINSVVPQSEAMIGELANYQAFKAAKNNE